MTILLMLRVLVSELVKNIYLLVAYMRGGKNMGLLMIGNKTEFLLCIKKHDPVELDIL